MHQLLEKVSIGVITAIVLGALALIWNWGSGGGLIRALGGVTKTDLPASGLLPLAAVIAIDTNVCPQGWELFREAGGRFLVGAGDHPNSSTKYAPGATGGEEQVTLTTAQIPPHSHAYVFSSGNYSPAQSDNSPNEFGAKDTSAHTETAGDGQPHENRPPYLALLFCKQRPRAN